VTLFNTVLGSKERLGDDIDLRRERGKGEKSQIKGKGEKKIKFGPEQGNTNDMKGCLHERTKGLFQQKKKEEKPAKSDRIFRFS
jgi:hypothetical protein